jgi:hypothetical protein
MFCESWKQWEPMETGSAYRTKLAQPLVYNHTIGHIPSRYNLSLFHWFMNELHPINHQQMISAGKTALPKCIHWLSWNMMVGLVGCPNGPHGQCGFMSQGLDCIYLDLLNKAMSHVQFADPPCGWSKPSHGEHQNSWDLWMFILSTNGIYRYWSLLIHSHVYPNVIPPSTKKMAQRPRPNFAWHLLLLPPHVLRSPGHHGGDPETDESCGLYGSI